MTFCLKIMFAVLTSVSPETSAGRADFSARKWAYCADPPSGMIRADVHFRDVVTNSTFTGVLVLSPGVNGDGSALLSDPGWVGFAERKGLLMVGVSFASGHDDLENGRGYYNADRGSGFVLLKGLSEAKVDSLPLYMYGFSGGAHFTSRFVAWRPQMVGAWCAYSAAWWDNPPSGLDLPPGIIACGRNDFRIDASLRFFECGRASGCKWLWICPSDVGHEPSPLLEAFFRKYVETLMAQDEAVTSGIWINVHSGHEEGWLFARRFPCAVGWLPARSLLFEWMRIEGS